MGVYEELQERGLIAQITNEDEVRELINNGKACCLRCDCCRFSQFCPWQKYAIAACDRYRNSK